MEEQLRIAAPVLTKKTREYPIQRIRSGINADGTLMIDYFYEPDPLEFVNRTSPSQEFWKSVKRNLVVTPAFLTVVFLVILFVPKSLLRLGPRLPIYLRLASKRMLDIFGAVLGILLSVGLFFWLPFVIRLDSRGKVIFRQKRIGQDRRREDRRKVSLAVAYDRRKGDRRKTNLMGQPFYVYKFRSMQDNAEQKTGPTWAKANDPRITRIGRFLRPSHVDEIPQFVNVLKGEMSLVGPRPERPEFVKNLNEKIPDYTKRLSCKPGITGLAQISWRYDVEISDVIKKLDYDLCYIRNKNLFLDIKILATTFVKVVFPIGNHAGQ